MPAFTSWTVIVNATAEDAEGTEGAEGEPFLFFARHLLASLERPEERHLTAEDAEDCTPVVVRSPRAGKSL